MTTEQPPSSPGKAEPPAEQPSGPSRRHNNDPKIPDVFRNTIPPTPRGWTDEEWRKSFLGSGSQRRSPLMRSGAGWLLPLILVLVVLVLVVVLVFER
jgi:hypothetical protein